MYRRTRCPMALAAEGLPTVPIVPPSAVTAIDRGLRPNDGRFTSGGARLLSVPLEQPRLRGPQVRLAAHGEIEPRQRVAELLKGMPAPRDEKRSVAQESRDLDRGRVLSSPGTRSILDKHADLGLAEFCPKQFHVCSNVALNDLTVADPDALGVVRGESDYGISLDDDALLTGPMSEPPYFVDQHCAYRCDRYFKRGDQDRGGH